MEHRGFIQLPRTVLDPSLWSNPVDFRIYTYVYLNACFKEHEIANIKLKKGQFLKSRRAMQVELSYIENRQIKEYSLSTIQRSIKRLVELKLIKEHGTQLGTLFTVLNYCNTGDNEKREPEPGTQLGTTAKQLRNNNNNVLIMDNKDDYKSDPVRFNFFDEFIKVFARQPTPIQIEKINAFLNEGISEELLIYGFKKAGTVTTNFRYLETMLSNWLKSEIQTLEDVERKDQKESAPNERYEDSAWRDKFGF
jgi:DnaD/phage-associated family protein